MGVFRPGAAVHDRIVEIIDNSVGLLPYVPKLWGKEKFAMNEENIVLMQGMIESQCIRPFLLREMDRYSHTMFFQIGEILKHAVAATADLQAVNEESDLHLSVLSRNKQNGFRKIDP